MTLRFRAARRFLIVCVAALSLLPPPAIDARQVSPAQVAPDWSTQFELGSTTFKNGSTLPQSMILNAAAIDGGTPIVGCEGSDESPELYWRNAPPRTRSFAIVMFDYDASVVHWAMYNIPPSRTSLPQNAGIPKSSYGQQIFNDVVYGDQNYDGPCPPSSFPHHYVITIYALDATGTLNAPSQLFPKYLNLPTGETLFNALIMYRSHILASASIVGLYGLPAGATQNAISRRRAP